MDFNDCVFSKNKDGKMMVGGYDVTDIMSTDNEMYSPIDDKNSNTNLKGGTNFANIFKDLAVPAGLLYLQQNFNPKETNYGYLKEVTNSATVIKNTLYDNLIELVSNTKKNLHNIQTRKKRSKKHNKTRKQ